MPARLVFDLDGTLIDSAPDLHAIANDLLRAEGVEPISLGEARAFMGMGAAVFVRHMCAARKIPAEAEARVLSDFLTRYVSAVTLTQPYPGVRAALDLLRAQGHALGICTNKPISPCRAVLHHLDLADYFDVIIGGDSLNVSKPDPAPLATTFAALPEGPRLFVGDSEVDAETAQRAEVPFLLFTEGYRKSPVSALPHTAAFASFADLPRLVKGLCPA